MGAAAASLIMRPVLVAVSRYYYPTQRILISVEIKTQITAGGLSFRRFPASSCGIGIYSLDVARAQTGLIGGPSREHAHHLDRWFDFAASTKARHVALDLSPLHYEHRIVASPNKYRLPANQLAAPAGIVSLLLVNVCLELPPVSDGSRLLGFKALKKLELKFVVDLGDLTPFLASCPALEWLSISSSLIGHLVVPRQARCLRYLRLDCIGMHSIHLDATSLTTFEYVGTSSIPIKTNHGLKLSQASIFIPWFFDGVSYFWDELSCWLAPVDRLLLSLGMDAETRRFAKNPTEFIHLRHLTLFCHILRDPESPLVVLRLTQVLESAPQLEHLGLV
ncbi:hypothetical protein SETIT_1G219500v2 [Setaria italica]|uniref:At1g61320/AtMIF1 LRR domain-containing protein n=1 Tax=Setaria italica TaxID=4555 RepID=A0A368PMW2_SETIT|nr:hypothetical protein SETIT_1G219500v2 [Setaria italica]